ncbi:WbqC family protein [Rubricoccus marinus]|uniref:WbqC family protein n=1 Tax=Rubricoccus marinus TaxID=716817 RepID=A0A259TXD0_9BACT|nr:WbqC family protein [Rubricoccus marinus]OZC02371.1 hypothetical protein BSZ36_04890 [Rubricoccus marinus]
MTAVRPPEFFPTPEVAALLLHAERVVLADTLPFSRQAAYNRAQIREAAGAQRLSIPRVHTGKRQPLASLEIAGTAWARKHVHALRTAYGMAPFAEHVLPEVEALLTGRWPSLGALTVATTRWTHRWLGATSQLVVASETPEAPASLADIWTASGEGALLALPSSAARDRQRLGVETHVLRYEHRPYRQTFEGWVPECSSLDLILNHGPDAARLVRERTTIRPLALEAAPEPTRPEHG